MDYKQIKDKVQTTMNAAQKKMKENGEQKNERLKQILINDMPGGTFVDIDFRPHQKDYINQVLYFDGKPKYNLKLSWTVMNWSVEMTSCNGDVIGRVKKVIVKNPLRHLTEPAPKAFELIECGAHKGKLYYYDTEPNALRRGYKLHYNGWTIINGKKANEIYIKDGDNKLLCSIIYGRNSRVFLGVKNAADEVMVLLITIAMMARKLHYES